MKQYNIVMQWQYHYDKEGTWFDDDEGVVSYVLQENTHFVLPHSLKERVEVRKVEVIDGVATAKIYVDYSTYIVTSGAEPVVAHASESYCAAGDCVDLSWVLKFTIE
ncbi:MAG: hypothetical protein IJX23_03145 [Clostridia bacterium]|nr:hypothetical protein [Clostridia bacterium]